MGKKTVRRSALPEAIPASSPSLRPVPLVGALALGGYWIFTAHRFYHAEYHAALWPFASTIFQGASSFTIGAIGNYVVLFLELSWLIALGAMIGRFLLARLGCDSKDPIEGAVFSLALGWGALATALGWLGLARALYFVPVTAALVAVTALLFVRKRPAAAAARLPFQWTAFERILSTGLIIFAALNFVAAMMPETFYDALVYHLALPELYWQRHGLYAVPWNIYSGMPMAAEMLYGLASRLGGDRLAHLINWTFGILCAGGVFVAARRFAGTRAGLIAALVFYSTPLVGILGWKSTVELGWASFQFLSVYAVVLAFDDWPNGAPWLICSGLLAGLAASCKYPAWISIGLIPAVAAWGMRRNGALVPVIAKKCLAIGLAALAVLAIWPIRNLILYRNPIFPFLQETFTQAYGHMDWRGLMVDAHSRSIKDFFANGAGFTALLFHPWYDLTLPHSDVEGLGPLLVLGLPLLFLPARNERLGLKIVLCALAFFWTAWLSTTSMVRFFVPVLPLVAIIYGTRSVSLPRSLQILGCGLLLFVAVDNFLSSADWINTYEAWAVIAGNETRDEYLSRPHPSYGRPDFPGIAFVRDHLPTGAEILVVDDSRAYGMDRDFIASSRFADDALLGFIRRSHSSEELRDLLKQAGVTHILLNEAEIHAGFSLPLSPEEIARYQGLGRFLKPIFERHDPARPDRAETWCAVVELN